MTAVGHCAGVLSTPLGAMAADVVNGVLVRLGFVDEPAAPALPVPATADGMLVRVQEELDAYFAGELRGFTVPVAPAGTPFQQDVWRMLQQIPYGVTRSYGDQARLLGRPTATRAVARANGENPIAIIIPCHRVLGANGRLTGYAGALWRKQRLLDLENGALF
jgi:O-6-methylguanine DNA methyltransferase